MTAVQPLVHSTPAPFRPRPLRSVPAGTTLFREGDAAGALYEVASGTLRLSRLLETGRRQVVAFAHAGDMVGFPSGCTYHADCEALTDATVIAEPRGVRTDPDQQRRLQEAALAEIAHLQDHLLLLARKGASGKLASFLGGLADRRGVAGPDGVAIDIEVPRADIADYLCISVETVSRTLTRMCAEGVVRRDGVSRLVVTDRVGLDAMACAD